MDDSDRLSARAALADRREVLAESCLRALQSTPSGDGAEIPATQLRQLAHDETRALLAFLAEGDRGAIRARAEQLARTRLGERAFTRLLHASAGFARATLSPCRSDDTLAALESYEEEALAAFHTARRSALLEEQERLRQALERTVHGYMVQMELATLIAHVTGASLALDALLATAVGLIQKACADFRSVALYLAHPGTGAAHLKAEASSEAGGGAAPPNIGPEDTSAVARTLATGAPCFVERPMGHESAGVRELALPIARGESVIGALRILSSPEAALSDQTTGGLCIVAAQLAAAIEIGRLRSKLAAGGTSTR